VSILHKLHRTVDLARMEMEMEVEREYSFSGWDSPLWSWRPHCKGKGGR
jgi:hypothetical protein